MPYGHRYYPVEQSPLQVITSSPLSLPPREKRRESRRRRIQPASNKTASCIHRCIPLSPGGPRLTGLGYSDMKSIDLASDAGGCVLCISTAESVVDYRTSSVNHREIRESLLLGTGGSTAVQKRGLHEGLTGPRHGMAWHLDHHLCTP